MGEPARKILFDEGRKVADAIQPGTSGTHAGFAVRAVALIIDAVILGLVNTLMSYAAQGPLAFIVMPASLILGLLYFAYFESSEYQGTPGKMIMSLKVTDLNGNRISFGKAVGRYFGKTLSAIILCIGFLMVIWDEKKQGLHDKILGTFVVKK